MKVWYKFCTDTLFKSNASYVERNFVDKLKLKVKAGNGGNGCVCYYRDRTVVSGAPDGGDGGKGGDIYFKANKSVSDLSFFKKPLLQGNDGKSGAKLKSHGKNGSDIRYSVPVGTLVYEVLQERKHLIADLEAHDKECIVARGGKGGKGNANNIGIREVQEGAKGQTKQVMLELKTIADIGLVGFPNAGKSTLLAASSRALPKIAEYPFTTLNPMVGKVRFIDGFEMTLADIPGLIEDAHKDRGLGLEFLRHVERCRMILYLLDSTADFESQLRILKQELKNYNPKLLEKPSFVCVNKIDLKENSFDYMGVSAKHGINVGQLLLSCRETVQRIKNEELRVQKEQEHQKKLVESRKMILEKQML